MLQLLSAVFGFAAPFLPQLFQFFQRGQDNAHELAMMEMRLKHAAQEHLWRMEEVEAQADIAEMQSLRAPQQSFGVQLLDAADKYATGRWGKFLLTPVFYLFAFLDWINGMVRPSVTFAMVGFYIAFKVALYQSTFSAAGSWQAAMPFVWTENDWAVLVLVLSYYFGARTAKAVFGGNASTGRTGGG